MDTLEKIAKVLGVPVAELLKISRQQAHVFLKSLFEKEFIDKKDSAKNDSASNIAKLARIVARIWRDLFVTSKCFLDRRKHLVLQTSFLCYI